MKGEYLPQNENEEEKIINIIKEACRVPDLQPEDWKKYGPKVIYLFLSKIKNINNYIIQLSSPNKKDYTFHEKAKLKSLLIYDMPKEFRKQVNINIIIKNLKIILQIWLISTGVKKLLEYNKNYYSDLIRNYPDNFISPYEVQINLDLERTFPSKPFFQEQKNIIKLKNILLAFSRRNSTIGYCQGFNFIVGKILEVCEDEVIK